MAGRAYLTQPRDREGKWAGSIVGRTKGGVLKAQLTDRADNIPGRSRLSAGGRAKATRAKVKNVDQERATALAGGRVPHTSPVLYASPKKIAEARKARGHIVRPRGEALAVARDRAPSAAAQRAVAFNPLSGRFTESSARSTGKTTGVEGSRPVTRASAARAKKSAKKPARGKLAPKPEYVGRRRAQP